MQDRTSTKRAALARRVPLRFRNGTVVMSGVMLSVSGFDDDPVGLERALRSFFLGRRPTAIDRLGNKYPETTVLEIAQVASILYDESRRYVDKRSSSWRDSILFGALPHIADALGRDDDYGGHADTVKRFADYYATLKGDLTRLPPWERSPQNEVAWREFGRLAIRLGVAADNPVPEGDYLRSVVRSAKKLPETLSDTAAAVSRAALGPVRAAGWQIAKAFVLPVAVGGGALVAAALLLRSSSSEREGAS